MLSGKKYDQSKCCICKSPTTIDTNGSILCKLDTCYSDGCPNPNDFWSRYCYDHRCKYCSLQNHPDTYAKNWRLCKDCLLETKKAS